VARFQSHPAHIHVWTWDALGLIEQCRECGTVKACRDCGSPLERDGNRWVDATPGGTYDWCQPQADRDPAYEPSGHRT
jgi:hypothetical protein